jgi:hypothetical protein
MARDDKAETLIRKTPVGTIDIAITTVEEFAQEKAYECITRALLAEQMSSIGMDPDSSLK